MDLSKFEAIIDGGERGKEVEYNISDCSFKIAYLAYVIVSIYPWFKFSFVLNMVMTIEFKQVEPRVKLGQNIIYLQFFTFSGKMRSFFFFFLFFVSKKMLINTSLLKISLFK